MDCLLIAYVAATAVGPGAVRRGAQGGRRLDSLGPPPPPWRAGGGIDWGGDPSGYYTKPQKTIQSTKTLYKAPEDFTKPQKDYTKLEKDYTKTQNIEQE